MKMFPILILLLLAFSAQARAEPLLVPPGTLFQVFDMQLHVVCSGPADAPGVVLEAGMAGNFLDWTKVQPALARTLRVCSYDRAGAGFSSRTERPRSAAAITEELHELVRAADIPRPFVLVGHSFGGVLSMSYAKQYPADVAGLVLVDSMAPDQFTRFAAAGVELSVDPRMVLGNRSGAAAYGLPLSLRAEAIELATADKARVFTVREMNRMVDSAEQVSEAGLPIVPARVLVHGDREWDGMYPDGRMERVWTAMQGDMARAMGAPPPTVVANSGHQIALDAPDAVVDAVLALRPPR